MITSSWVRHIGGHALAFACLLPGFAQATDVSVTEAWISAAPPTVRVNAGYSKIRNTGARAVILAGAESPRFARIEMHQSEMKNGTYKMHRQYSLVLDSGQSLAFAPGGLHLMLFNSTQPLKPRERIPVTLIFADGLRIPVMAEVRPPQPGAGHHNH